MEKYMEAEENSFSQEFQHSSDHRSSTFKLKLYLLFIYF